MTLGKGFWLLFLFGGCSFSVRRFSGYMSIARDRAMSVPSRYLLFAVDMGEDLATSAPCRRLRLSDED